MRLVALYFGELLACLWWHRGASGKPDIVRRNKIADSGGLQSIIAASREDERVN